MEEKSDMSSSSTFCTFGTKELGESTWMQVVPKRCDAVLYAVPHQELVYVSLDFKVEMPPAVYSGRDFTQVPVKMNLRLPSSTSTVCKLQVDGTLACSVSKSVAARVQTNEMHKGRNVSTISHEQGNVWETTLILCETDAIDRVHCVSIDFVSPMAPMRESSPGLRCVSMEWLVGFPVECETAFSLQTINPTGMAISHIDMEHSIANLTTEGAGDATTLVTAVEGAGLTLRVSFPSRTHTICVEHDDMMWWRSVVSLEGLRSSQPCARSSKRASPQPVECVDHVAVWIDTSASAVALKRDLIELIHALAAQEVLVSIWTFDTTCRKTVSATLAADIVAHATLPTLYDGGSDLTCLERLVVESAAAGCKAVFLVSDGKDNLNGMRKPNLDEVPMPVHVANVSCTSDCNASYLQWVARTSGGLFMPANSDLATVLQLNASGAHTIRSLRLDFGDKRIDAFESERVQTCPDYRLSHDSTVSTLPATVTHVGSHPCEYPLNSHALLRVDDELFEVTIDATATASLSDALRAILARAIEVDMARRSIHEVVTVMPDLHHHEAERIAIAANIACEHTSMLVLRDAQQFIDNEIVCPRAHSEFEAWQALHKQHEATVAQRLQAKRAARRHKIEDQLKAYKTAYERLTMKVAIDAETDGQCVYRSLGGSATAEDVKESASHHQAEQDTCGSRAAMSLEHLTVVPDGRVRTPDEVAEVYGSDRFEAEYHQYLLNSPSIAPSTFIELFMRLRERDAARELCVRVISNILELEVPSAQTCRCVAYYLLELKCVQRAIDLFRHIKTTLDPAQPHSYIDFAMACIFYVKTDGTMAAMTLLKEAIAALTHVLVVTEWPVKYPHIEWPCLLLLNWAVQHGEDLAAPLEPSNGGTTSLWPEEDLPAAALRLADADGRFRLKAFVWLGWNTDNTDVDLHVHEPTGTRVWYNNRFSTATGGTVSQDVTQGYGPEVYTCYDAPAGEYKVFANYYASHQPSTETGSTSALLWSITNMGQNDETEQFQLKCVRLKSTNVFHIEHMHEVLTLCV